MFCCICNNKRDLKHLFEVDNDGLSHYNKLTSSIAEMDFKEMNDQRLICGECCVTLNTVYNFRQMCLRSKIKLITYVSQLQTSGHVSGTLSVRPEDIKLEIVDVKEEIETKCKNEDNSSIFEENDPLSGFKTESYEESIQFPASVMEKSEEDSSAHEDTTVDYVNDDAHSDVKVEVEHQTMVEDESYVEFSEIVIKEDPLAVVKEEPMSDSETPQDGSTSQAVAVTYGEPKESETTKFRLQFVKDTQKDPHILYKCVICERSFNEKKRLNKHMRSHSEKQHACEICKKRFLLKCDLTRHMLTHSGERPFECEICKRRFTLKNDLNRHMVTHSGEKPYECEICKRSFALRYYLNKHMLTHSDETPYEKSDTETPQDGSTSQADAGTYGEPKESETTFGLTKDTQKVPDVIYKCVICEKSFTEKIRFNKHMRNHSEKPHPCEICNMRFVLKFDLTRHMFTHSGERPYECEICKRRFGVKYALNRHMLLHSGERPYECDICEKRFVVKSDLTKHMLTHSGGRPYECEICKRCFALKYDLNRHMLIHSGERPYECEICKKGFSQKSNLSIHMRTHSVELPFECEICNKGFKVKCNLTKHMRIHSDDRPYECEICTKGFSDERDLTRHKRIHYREKNKSE